MGSLNNPLALPANSPKIKTGQYTGDGSQNRAVAHTCGVIPSFVVIVSNASPGDAHTFGLLLAAGYMGEISGYVCTIMDATNFYVGNGIQFYENVNLKVYNWIAFYL